MSTQKTTILKIEISSSGAVFHPTTDELTDCELIVLISLLSDDLRLRLQADELGRHWEEGAARGEVPQLTILDVDDLRRLNPRKRRGPRT